MVATVTILCFYNILQIPEDNFAAKLKLREEGKWECNVCFCLNEASMTVCPKCETSKPGSTPFAKPPTQSDFKTSTSMPLGKQPGMGTTKTSDRTELNHYFTCPTYQKQQSVSSLRVASSSPVSTNALVKIECA